MKRYLFYLIPVLLVACLTACRATRTITITATSVNPASDTTHIGASIIEDYKGETQKHNDYGN